MMDIAMHLIDLSHPEDIVNPSLSIIALIETDLTCFLVHCQLDKVSEMRRVLLGAILDAFYSCVINSTGGARVGKLGRSPLRSHDHQSGQNSLYGTTFCMTYNATPIISRSHQCCLFASLELTQTLTKPLGLAQPIACDFLPLPFQESHRITHLNPNDRST
jgi:hypothetical protein